MVQGQTPTQGEQTEEQTSKDTDKVPAEENPQAGGDLEKQPEESKTSETDLSSYSLEAIKEKNPEVAKALSEHEELKKRHDEDNKKREEAEKKKKEEEGKWQELAQDNENKLKDAESKQKQTQEKLDKYSQTVENILKEIESGVPEEKKGLIPEDFSPRQKLEYIVKNAQALGTQPLNKGGAVPNNQEDHPQDEEGKLNQEYSEINKKIKDGTATRTDQNKLLEIGDKLKELQTRKQ